MEVVLLLLDEERLLEGLLEVERLVGADQADANQGKDYPENIFDGTRVLGYERNDELDAVK